MPSLQKKSRSRKRSPKKSLKRSRSPKKSLKKSRSPLKQSLLKVYISYPNMTLQEFYRFLPGMEGSLHRYDFFDVWWAKWEPGIVTFILPFKRKLADKHHDSTILESMLNHFAGNNYIHVPYHSKGTFIKQVRVKMYTKNICKNSNSNTCFKFSEKLNEYDPVRKYLNDDEYVKINNSL